MASAADDSPAERPRLLDLSRTSEAALAAAVRDGWQGPRGGDGEQVVIDLGDRRTLPPEAVEELVLTHRALRRARGRCALVVGPALAAQLSLAHPEALLVAANRRAAFDALRSHRAPIVVGTTLRPSLHIELAGEVDLATLTAVESLLAGTLVAAHDRREIVFDLTGLTFVDLMGLRVITSAAVRCQLAGAPTRVFGAGPQVRRLVRQLGWQAQLPGVDDPPPTRSTATAHSESGSPR